MNETITVTGKGKLSIPPDMIEIRITMETTQYSYEKTMSEAAEQLAALRKELKREGFEKEDIKTSYFNVEVEYERIKGNDQWFEEFAGYKCKHKLVIEFPSDSKKLGRVLRRIEKCQVNPEFSIYYTIQDLDGAKNQLLAKAVEDSKEKAQILVKAAGVNLGKVKNIQYAWTDVRVYSREYEYGCSYSAEEQTNNTLGCLDINPEDLDLSDTVTVVWEIEE